MVFVGGKFREKLLFDVHKYADYEQCGATCGRSPGRQREEHLYGMFASWPMFGL